MNETLKATSYERSLSLDRFDIFENSSQVYPESYREFQNSIENIFFKSELLLKCKMEFERLIIIDIPETIANAELINRDLNLSLIFTGAIKSGRSSLINMLLNTKVMPTSVIGSSCCVNIAHPKSDAKQISVGVHDLDGWEIDKFLNVEISDLPTKIQTLQTSLSKKICEKTGKSTKRIHVQLPHWLLKNLNIYECPAIDGMYSFEEPFDIIMKSEHPILIHVIDATNALMQWDRTFLAKIQHHFPHLPIFFVINHVDVQEDTIIRDRGLRFESLVSDKFKNEPRESESSGHNSTDDANSESYSSPRGAFDTLIMKQEAYLIDKCKKQLKKLGFMLENETATRYASLSVKEFTKIVSSKEKEMNSYWILVDTFFIKFGDYLTTWLENLLITSSLELKSRINGVVDAARCQILCASEVMQDVTSDTYLQDIRKAENKIKDEFLDIQSEFDKLITKSVKEQLKRHEQYITKTLPDLTTDDNSQILHIIKPKLLETFETILFASIDKYNVDDEIVRILDLLYIRLETAFIKLYKPNKMLSFFEYILNLFRTLKRTMVYPLISRLPDDVIQSENKWYKELLKHAARRFRGPNVSHQNLVMELINDIKVTPLIKTTQLAIGNIYTQIQIFTKKYQETYKIARTKTFQKTDIGPNIFQKLLVVDFVIKVIEKSFQKQKTKIIVENLIKLPTFFNVFYENDQCMIRQINIQSFTSLSDEINILCVKRICRQHVNILIHKSTKLMDCGICLMFYSKMDYDLKYAMEIGTNWQTNDVIGIIKQLSNAVKCLLTYSQHVKIQLTPENIMLKKDGKGFYVCKLFPIIIESTALDQNFVIKRKLTSHISSSVYQLGMVMIWLLTNDIQACQRLNTEECTQSEFLNYLTNNILASLKQSNLIKVAQNFLFRTDNYCNIEMVFKEFDGM